MPSKPSLLALTALVALAAMADAAKPPLKGNLRTKRDRKLRRGRIQQTGKKHEGGGLEEDVAFWTNMVRKTQAMSVPVNPTEPPAGGDTILDIAAGNDDFSTLVAAVEAAGLEDALSGPGPLTVFAPNNDAFDALPEGTLESLLLPENVDALTAILTYHAVEGNVLSTDLVTGPVPTLNGATVDVVVGDDGSVTVGGANVIAADIIASNGVIHAIDTVLLPPANLPEGTPSPTPAVGDTPFPTAVDTDAPATDPPATDPPVGGGPPSGGSRCPPAVDVGCTAVDPANPVDECSAVGEPCPNANAGEVCCVDQCPRNYCTAKLVPAEFLLPVEMRKSNLPPTPKPTIWWAPLPSTRK